MGLLFLGGEGASFGCSTRDAYFAAHSMTYMGGSESRGASWDPRNPCRLRGSIRFLLRNYICHMLSWVGP